MSVKTGIPIIASLLDNLTDDLREDFEERAAIMEFDGGLDRTLAEALALLCLLHNHPYCLQTLVALEVQLEGEVKHVLTTALGDTRLRLEQMGAILVRVLDPVELIRDEFQGNVLLTGIEIF